MATQPHPSQTHDLIRSLAQECELDEIGFSQGNTALAAPQLREWLSAGYHGDMAFMDHHADLRCHPDQLVPGTVSIISATLPYWPEATPAQAVLDDPSKAYISRYALGRDYHKVLRQRLQKLATRLTEHIGPFGYRVFSDSAPVMEVEFAQQAQLGWRGKHSLLLSRQGSWKFLGEIYTDLPLAFDTTIPDDHCGHCTRCITSCPTQAIIAPYQVDARRCISYLTIEHTGPIPLEFRPLLGNRIYGCDDCQLVCPWNRFATTGDAEFLPRHHLDNATLVELFSWTKTQFEDRLAGNPIRRIGHERWLRNIAVALGNALSNAPLHTPAQNTIFQALQAKTNDPSALIQEHVHWAISQASP
ncbi:MAG: hypothetical protein RIR18_61 [Pseudomonadota bacterium]|jgi:epoxyqueuosine reductase